MAVGHDDTVASSSDTLSSASDPRVVDPSQIIANRYRIVRWLGGGGMGRVYEVLDTELDERVALKVLRAGLSEEGIERFRREVKLTRRIQHPNVCRMFDIGDHPRGPAGAGDEKFLTMELVDGQPLAAALGQTVPWQRLHGIAIQICEGLAAAHAVGVIHRDLKPDNVLVERSTDRAVITDFGIARGADDANVTQVGAIVGTPRYMAPEQLAGRDIDARADLFSLGVMLYELATASRPWSGDNAIAIAVAQATQPMRPFSSTFAPPWFGNIVTRCLAIDRDQRFASATEVAKALAAGAVASAFSSGSTDAQRTGRMRTPTLPPSTPTSALPTRAVPETAIAVMPLSCAPGDEYLADGVLEDLMDTLASGALRVRPAGVDRGSPIEPRTLGRDLGVDHVVAGSVRRVGPKLRVSARVIGVADGFQIWGERVDCAEAEILDVSDRLARGIATALSTRAATTTVTTAANPTDPRAVELYLRAKAELRKFFAGHARTAAETLEEAAALAPESVPIAGTLALATTQCWTLTAEPAYEERARRTIERGLQLGAAEAYLASSSFKMSYGDVEGGAADLGVALVRGPMNGLTHEHVARILVEIASTSRARQYFDTAIAFDPSRAQIISLDLARLDALEGRWEEADRAVDVALAHSDPTVFQLGMIFRARLSAWRRRRDEMHESVVNFAPKMSGFMAQFIRFVGMAAQGGNFERAVFEQFLTTFGGPGKPKRGQLMGLQILSEVSMMFDNPDLSFETLELAESMGFMDIVALDYCPLYRSADGDPRFERIRTRVRARAAHVLAAFEAAAGAVSAP